MEPRGGEVGTVEMDLPKPPHVAVLIGRRGT